MYVCRKQQIRPLLCFFFVWYFQLVSIDRANFSVEAIVTAKATSLKVRTSPSSSASFHASVFFVLDHVSAYFVFLSVCFRASIFFVCYHILRVSVVFLPFRHALMPEFFRFFPHTPSSSVLCLPLGMFSASIFVDLFMLPLNNSCRRGFQLRTAIRCRQSAVNPRSRATLAASPKQCLGVSICTVTPVGVVSLRSVFCLGVV